MNDIPVEKKLELVHQLRSKYNENQSDMMNREMLLYGRTMSGNRNQLDYSTDKAREYFNHTDDNEAEGIFKDDTLKLRYALAAVLFVLIILFDVNGKNLAGISMDRLFAAIETDYEDSLNNWIEVLSQ